MDTIIGREGASSLLDDSPTIEFEQRIRNQWPLATNPKLLDSYLFFTHDFVRYREQNKQLIVSDLRMGMPDQAAFEFVFALRDNNEEWKAITPTRFKSERFNVDIKALFQRILGNKTPEVEER